jgi:hypothetical protein
MRSIAAAALLAGLLVGACGPGPSDDGGASGSSAGAAALPAGEEFGSALTLGDVTGLQDVVRRPQAYADRPVLVRARVYDVCQRKGCWMVLREGDSEVRVSFKDYGFFVPRDCTGQLAYVEGRVTSEMLGEEDARHYAGESLRDDPAQIEGPQRVVALEATGVRLIASN